MTVWEQVLSILRSRKFWALVVGLITVWGAYLSVPGSITVLQAVQATVVALAAYAVGTGLEGPAIPRG